MSTLILASTSAARRALMDSLGLPYRAVAPGVSEQLPGDVDASTAVLRLAHLKAAAVFQREPGSLVIGADQLVELEGAVHGKAADRTEAKSQLQRLSGRTHRIHTGVCLLGPGIDERAEEITHLTMYPLEATEIERYLDCGEWLGCAGSYRIEGQGQALFSRIEGDRSNVQGLPMVLLVRLLRRAGVAFFPSDGQSGRGRRR